MATAAAAREAGKGAGDELQRQRLLGNSGNDAREDGWMHWRALRVPTASRSTTENLIKLNVDRNDGGKRRGGDVLRPWWLSVLKGRKGAGERGRTCGAYRAL